LGSELKVLGSEFKGVEVTSNDSRLKVLGVSGFTPPGYPPVAVRHTALGQGQALRFLGLGFKV